MNNEIETLQTRLTYQESAIQEMSDEIANQQRQITALLNDVEQLRRELRSMTPSMVAAPADEPPPPHY
jgi:SlyX protein